jgi:hypothetical protein
LRLWSVPAPWLRLIPSFLPRGRLVRPGGSRRSDGEAGGRGGMAETRNAGCPGSTELPDPDLDCVAGAVGVAAGRIAEGIVAAANSADPEVEGSVAAIASGIAPSPGSLAAPSLERPRRRTD